MRPLQSSRILTILGVKAMYPNADMLGYVDLHEFSFILRYLELETIGAKSCIRWTQWRVISIECPSEDGLHPYVFCVVSNVFHCCQMRVQLRCN